MALLQQSGEAPKYFYHTLFKNILFVKIDP
jgi:hypothetical protein